MQPREFFDKVAAMMTKEEKPVRVHLFYSYFFTHIF